MNVYLDAQPLLGAKAGIYRYVKNLYKELLKDNTLNLSLAFNRIFKSVSASDIGLSQADADHVVNQMFPYKVIRRLLKPNFLYNFPYDLQRHKADIFHGTNFTYTPTVRGKSIITIHDLAYMLYPESTSERIFRHHSRWVPYSAVKCDHIIADSEQTKRDIVRLLNVDADKVDVVYLAADEKLARLSEEEYRPVLHKYKLPERYILFVGTLEPRKNLSGLLEAYALLRVNSDRTPKLVIVGANGWKFSSIYERVQERHMENDVIFTGFVEDGDLAAIYSGAIVAVMPSIYEGFGLPILEAMKCGVPVIGSDVSSIPEIVGEYGILVPPHNDEEWAKSLHRITANESEQRRYSALALERSGHYNWHRVAQETKQVYQKVLSH